MCEIGEGNRQARGSGQALQVAAWGGFRCGPGVCSVAAHRWTSPAGWDNRRCPNQTARAAHVNRPSSVRPTAAILTQAVRRHASAAAWWSSIALLALALSASTRASAQDVPAVAASTDKSVVAPAEIEAPRELSVRDAERSVASRKQRLLQVYDEWQQVGLERGGDGTTEVDPEAAAAAYGHAPPPDAPDGAITREREQQEVAR